MNYQLERKIEARDRTIARLEAELKDKREALALEIMAHEKTRAALRECQTHMVNTLPARMGVR